MKIEKKIAIGLVIVSSLTIPFVGLVFGLMQTFISAEKDSKKINSWGGACIGLALVVWSTLGLYKVYQYFEFLPSI